MRVPDPPEARAAQARAAALSRHHPDLVDKITEARRDAKELQLAGYIKRVVDQAPPLTSEQRDRLALLLRGDAA